MGNFFSVFGIAGLGSLVGVVVFVFVLASIDHKTRNTNKQFETNCVIVGGSILVVSVISLVITGPVDHWLEIALIGTSLSGFATRWVGIALVRAIDVSDLAGIITMFLAPAIALGILTAILDAIWFQVLL